MASLLVDDALSDRTRRDGVVASVAGVIVPFRYSGGQVIPWRVGLPQATAEVELDIIVTGRAVQVPNASVGTRDQEVRWWARSWRPPFLRFLFNVILPLGIVITTAIAAVNHGSVRVYWSLGSFVCIAITGLVNYSKDRSTAAVHNAALRLTADMATVLNDTGRPLVAALGNVTAASVAEDARREVAVLVDRAVSLAQTEIGRSSKTRTRAVLYRIEGDRLELKKYFGWATCQAPRSDFIRGRSEHDNEVFRIVEGENALLITDLENHPPAHFMDARGRPYKSFIAVPVRAGLESFGLLTADSEQAYALDEVEMGFLILIAGVLGAGMAHVQAIEAQQRD